MKTTKLLKYQSGFGLIEIMIASLIGLFLIGGLMQMFITSKQTYKLQDSVSRLQENGRFAMDFLVRDIRASGSWGCSSDLTKVASFLNPGGIYDILATKDALGNDIPGGGIAGQNDQPVTGISGTTGINTTPDTTPDSLTLVSNTYLQDSSTGDGVAVLTLPASTDAALEVSAPSDPNDITAGDILFVNDCDTGNGSKVGSVFQVDSFVASTTPCCPATPTLILQHTASAPTSAVIHNKSNNLDKVYNVGAKVYKVNFVTYDVHVSPETNQPTLFRTINDGTAQGLVEGVENMQILYGVDSDATPDGTPNYYLTADQISNDTTITPNMKQVVSLKITLVIRSLEDNLTGTPVPYNLEGVTVTPPAGDTHIRRVFSSVITIRNRLM